MNIGETKQMKENARKWKKRMKENECRRNNKSNERTWKKKENESRRNNKENNISLDFNNT